MPCMSPGSPRPRHSHPNPPYSKEMFLPHGPRAAFCRGPQAQVRWCLWVPSHGTRSPVDTELWDGHCCAMVSVGAQLWAQTR